MDDTAYCGRSSESANCIVTEINSINLEHRAHWSDTLLTTCCSTSICEIFKEALWGGGKRAESMGPALSLAVLLGEKHTGM